MTKPWEMDWGNADDQPSAPDPKPWDMDWTEAPAEDKPWYNDAYETGRQIGAGAAVDLPRMGGEALQAFSPEGSGVSEFGREMVAGANERAPEWAPDMEGRGPVAEAFIGGARSIAPSAATMAAYAIPYAGPLATVALFGGSQYQEEYEKVKAAGGTDEEAHQAGLLTGAIQGGGEVIANRFGLGMFGANKKLAAEGVKGLIGKAVDTSVVKPWAKSVGKAMIGEPATEIAQDVATEAVDRNYGVGSQDYGDILKQSGGAAAAMTAMLAPLGLVGHYKNARRAEAIDTLLTDPASAPPAERAAVVSMLHADAKRLGIQDADAWMAGATEDIQANRPVRRETVIPAPVIPTAPPTAPLSTLPVAERAAAAKLAADQAQADAEKFTTSPGAAPIKPIPNRMPETPAPEMRRPGFVNFVAQPPTTSLGATSESAAPSAPGIPFTPSTPTEFSTETPEQADIRLRREQSAGALPNLPANPMVVFKDGTVARQGEVEAEAARLESIGDAQGAADLRAKVLGYASQPAEAIAPQEAAQAPTSEQPIVQKNGKPFSTEKAATLAIKSRKLTGHVPVQVEGGFALQQSETALNAPISANADVQGPVVDAQAPVMPAAPNETVQAETNQIAQSPDVAYSQENQGDKKAIQAIQAIDPVIAKALTDHADKTAYHNYLRGRLGKPEFMRRKAEIDAAYAAAYPSAESQVAAVPETHARVEQVAETAPVAEQSRPGDSWVIRNKETGEVIMETFDRKKVDALNTAKYEAVPALQHLQEFNRKVREQAPAKPNILKSKSERDREAAAAQQPTPTEIPQPKTNDEVTAIPKYTVYKAGNRFAVRGEGVRGGGDTLHDTQAAAESESQLQKSRDEQNEASRKRDKQAADEKAAQDQEKERVAIEGYRGFLSDTPMTRQRQRDALEKQISHKGVVKPRKEMIDELLADGYYVAEGTHGARELVKGDSFYSADVITKTGLDYAEHILAQDGASAGTLTPEQPQTAAKPEKSTITPDVKTVEQAAPIKNESNTQAAENQEETAQALEPVAEPIKESEPAAEQRSEPAQAEEEAATPEAQPETPATAITPENYNLEAHDEIFKRVHDGDMTAAEFKASFEAFVQNREAIARELSGMTKAAMFRVFGQNFEWRNKNDKKDEVVRAAVSSMTTDYVLSGSFSYGMGKDSMLNVVRDSVAKTTDESLAEYANTRKAKTEEFEAELKEKIEGAKDPKTIEDFQRAIRLKMDEGLSFADARMALTVEQRVTFDRMLGEKTRTERGERKTADRTNVRAAGATTGAEIVATKHTKKGHDLYVVQAAERVERDVYTQWNATAKKLGGYYSSFRGGGAIPGFQFPTREGAEAFKAYVSEGDTDAVREQAKARRDAFEDDRSQSAVERLREMADKLEARADESLNQDRKANTDRRARMAASAEAAANGDKATAETMRNIADAIENGNAKFLDRVRQKIQVESLEGYIRSAKNDENRKKYPAYIQQEQHKYDPATEETADYAEWPTYTMYRSDLANLGRAISEVEGLKQMGRKILSVADDVTSAYLKFARENIGEVSTFRTRSGERAAFKSKGDAEEAIARSGYKGQAVVLPFKRGENLIIMSPSEAQRRGIWKGDDDKRISLNAEFAAELVTKMGRRKHNGVTVPWQLENAHLRRTRLTAMGIETPAEFRSALREFIALQQPEKAPDKIKEMERAMIGRAKDGLDFFPTPASVADQMIEAAGIEEGMSVLEPSGGMGHIAERIREAGVDPDVVELSGSRRELLEAKGFRLVGSDFMDMNPRGYTFGDTFKAPDGTEGVMRGLGGLGSNRVRLVVNGDERTALYVDRDSLEPVRKSNTDSGYDRIIMNPPFSDRRDAEHVKHAYDLLKPGGRLVAIMGEGVFFGNDKKATEFRDWLESVGATDEKLPEGTFMDASLPVNTGVNARMVVIEKDADSQSGAAAYSRKANNTPASTPTTLESALSKPLAALRKTFPVNVVQSASDVPGNHPSDIRGVYMNGAVWIVADNVSAKDAAEVLAHEAVGHLGLETLLGRTAFMDMVKIVQTQKRMGSKRVMAIVEQLKKSYTDADGKYNLDSVQESREVLAHIAEGKAELLTGSALQKLYQRIKAKVRLWLASKGFGSVEDALIDSLIVRAARMVQGAAMPGVSLQQAAAYQRRRDSGTTDAMTTKQGSGDNLTDTQPLEPESEAVQRAIAAARKEQDRLNSYDIENEAESIRSSGDIDISDIQADPNLWDDEYETLTDAGLEEYDNRVEQKARDNLRLREINTLEDLDYAHALAQYDAMEELLRKTGINYHSVGSASTVSRYITIGDNLKIRFSDHANRRVEYNEGEDSDSIRVINVAPGVYTFTDAVDSAMREIAKIKAAQNPNPSQRSQGAGDDTAYSRKAAPVSPSDVEATLFDELRFKAQDKFHYLNKVQKAVAAERGIAELPEAEDAYLAELRYHGMAGAAIEDFQREHVDPLIEAISAAKLGLEDVDLYLRARHAEEANAQLERINPDREDNQALSGMSNEEAAEILGRLDSPAMRDIGARVDAITKARRDKLVDAGLETQETVDAWEGAYQHYVPLHREGFDGRLPSKGKGFDTRGKEKRRAGSNRDVVHVLANVVAQYEATAIKAEKVKVGKAFLEFARNNPNPDLYEVDKVEYKPTFDAEGLVTYREDKGFVMAPNILVVRVDGVDHRITFSERSDVAKRIVHAIKNLGADDSGPIVNALSKLTRWLAIVNTGANPEFVISNFARDLQTAGYNLTATAADKLKWKIIKDVGKSWRGIRSFQKQDGKHHEWAQYFDEFRRAGAQTGWLQSYSSIEDREQALIQKIRDMSKDTMGIKVKSGMRAVIEFIENENTAVENAIRLSAFVHARRSGLSEAQAARIAKEMTVNFNRKGDMGQVLNALYLFYNASIQGTVRLLQAVAKSRKVQLMAGATVIFAAVLDMINRALGGDDDDGESKYDKIPDFVKERNLIIMLPSGGGDYIKIPLPWGYNVLHVMGQGVGEAMTQRDFQPGKSAMRVAAATVSAFNPIGGSESILQFLSPTITDPLVQWAENKDWSGKPLRPASNPFGIDTPNSQKYWNSVRAPSKWLTDQLNTLTGGDEVRPGAIDISPEAVDLLVDTFTGGAGRFVADTFATPAKVVQGEPIETYEVPVLRKVYGAPGRGTLVSDFYERMEAVQVTDKQLKHYKGDHAKISEIRRARAGEVRLLGDMKLAQSQLRKIRKQIKAAEKSGNEVALKSAKDREEEVMRRFNKSYNQKMLRFEKAS